MDSQLRAPASFTSVVSSTAPLLPSDAGIEASSLTLDGMTSLVDNPQHAALASERKELERTIALETSARARLVNAAISATHIVNDRAYQMEATRVDALEAAVRVYAGTPLLIVAPPRVAAERNTRLHDAFDDVRLQAAEDAMVRLKADTNDRIAPFVDRIATELDVDEKNVSLAALPVTREELEELFSLALQTSAAAKDGALRTRNFDEAETLYYARVVKLNVVEEMATVWFDEWARKAVGVSPALVAKLRSYVHQLVYDSHGRVLSHVAENAIPSIATFEISYAAALDIAYDAAAVMAGFLDGDVAAAAVARRRAIDVVSGTDARLRLRAVRASFTLTSLTTFTRERLDALQRRIDDTDRFTIVPLVIERDGSDTRPLQLFVRVNATIPLTGAAIRYTFSWMQRRGPKTTTIKILAETDKAGDGLTYAPLPSTSEPAAPAESLAGEYWVRVERFVDNASTAILFSPVVRVLVRAECVRCREATRFEIGPNAPERVFGECYFAEAPINARRATYMRTAQFRTFVAALGGGTGNGFDEQPRFDDALGGVDDARLLALASSRADTERRFFTLGGLLERADERLRSLLVERYENTKIVDKLLTITPSLLVAMARLEHFDAKTAYNLFDKGRKDKGYKKFVIDVAKKKMRTNNEDIANVASAADLPLNTVLNGSLDDVFALSALPRSDRRFLDELALRLRSFTLAANEDVSAFTEQDVRSSTVWFHSPLVPRTFDATTMFVDWRGAARFRERVETACARSFYTDCAIKRRRLVEPADRAAVDFVGRHSASTRQPTPYTGTVRGSARLRTPFDFDALHARIVATNDNQLRRAYNALAQFAPRIASTNGFATQTHFDLDQVLSLLPT